QVWDTHSGEVIRTFDDKHPGKGLLGLAFCPRGRYLVFSSSDTCALVWDLCDYPPKSPGVSSHPEKLEGSWEALQHTNPIVVDRALWAFVAAKNDGVRFLKRHLAVWKKVDSPRLLNLIQLLDHASFRVRKEAERGIVAFGEGALPDLHRYLTKTHCTLEQRYRIQHVLQTISVEALRESRAISALEYVGTEEAQQVLTWLASSPPGSSRAKVAAGALRRLQKLSCATCAGRN